MLGRGESGKENNKYREKDTERERESTNVMKKNGTEQSRTKKKCYEKKKLKMNRKNPAHYIIGSLNKYNGK